MLALVHFYPLSVQMVDVLRCTVGSWRSFCRTRTKTSVVVFFFFSQFMISTKEQSKAQYKSAKGVTLLRLEM